MTPFLPRLTPPFHSHSSIISAIYWTWRREFRATGELYYRWCRAMIRSSSRCGAFGTIHRRGDGDGRSEYRIFDGVSENRCRVAYVNWVACKYASRIYRVAAKYAHSPIDNSSSSSLSREKVGGREGGKKGRERFNPICSMILRTRYRFWSRRFAPNPSRGAAS